MAREDFSRYVLYLITYYIVILSVSFILRNGIPERRRSHVSHSDVRTISGTEGLYLRCRNRIGFEVLAHQRHSVQVMTKLFEILKVRLF